MKLLAVAALTISLSACGGKDHEVIDSEPEEFFAIFYGQVVDNEGVGVANVPIRARTYRTCADTASVGQGTGLSRANGTYSVRVTAPDTERRCVTVFAIPTSQSFLPDSARVTNVLFSKTPTDSLQRNLTLRLPGGGGGGPIITEWEK